MPKLEKKSEIIKEPSWSVITTTTESVFTINLMEPEIPFSQWTNAAMKLFQSETKYIPPKEFGYKLPQEGIPEYAFVGRSLCLLQSVLLWLIVLDQMSASQVLSNFFWEIKS
jgi:hypothetical protein